MHLYMIISVKYQISSTVLKDWEPIDELVMEDLQKDNRYLKKF